MKNKYISVGKILNFHGIKGEAKVGFSKSQEDFLSSLKIVFIGEKFEEFHISSVRFHKNFAIIKFEEINSVNELMTYKGEFLFVEEKSIKENLDNDEFLIKDLVGMPVFDIENKKLATVIAVTNNGASDLLTVTSENKKQAMIPFVKEIVLNVDLENKKIVINNIQGLIEE
jgi:16S rRNA processing protein RimM